MAALTKSDKLQISDYRQLHSPIHTIDYGVESHIASFLKLLTIVIHPNDFPGTFAFNAFYISIVLIPFAPR
jgi:hypothetical protein